MTALLLMDFQRLVVDSYAVDKEALLGRVKRLAAAARNSGAMVIHVIVGFQLGYPVLKLPGFLLRETPPPRSTPNSPLNLAMS
jgi:nicotinamidase-related amidase